MRYKLDENLGTRTQDLFWARGRLWIVEMGRVRIHEDGIDAHAMNAGPL